MDILTRLEQPFERITWDTVQDARAEIQKLRAALKEACDELKVAESRFAASGQDSAAARMNVAARNARDV